MQKDGLISNLHSFAWAWAQLISLSKQRCSSPPEGDHSASLAFFKIEKKPIFLEKLQHKRQHIPKRSRHVGCITGGPRDGQIICPCNKTSWDSSSLRMSWKASWESIQVCRWCRMSDIKTWNMQSARGLPGLVPRFVVAIFCATVMQVLAWTSLMSWIRKAGAPSCSNKQGRCRRAHMSAMGKFSWSMAANTSSKSSSTWMPDIHSRTKR